MSMTVWTYEQGDSERTAPFGPLEPWEDDEPDQIIGLTPEGMNAALTLIDTKESP